MRHIPLYALYIDGLFAIISGKLSFTILLGEQMHFFGTKLAILLFRRLIQASRNIIRFPRSLCLELLFLLNELIIWNLNW